MHPFGGSFQPVVFQPKRDLCLEGPSWSTQLSRRLLRVDANSVHTRLVTVRVEGTSNGFNVVLQKHCTYDIHTYIYICV